MEQIPSWFQVMAGGSALSVAGFYALRLVWRKITEESAATQRAAGEVDIIENLRHEVERLADLNEQLSKRLAELQNEIIDLRKENADLKSEIQSLNLQIQTMSAQKRQCAGCTKLIDIHVERSA